MLGESKRVKKKEEQQRKKKEERGEKSQGVEEGAERQNTGNAPRTRAFEMARFHLSLQTSSAHADFAFPLSKPWTTCYK